MVEFIVDTNVPLIARGTSHMSLECEENCATFIERFLRGRQILVIDEDYFILEEYLREIKTTGPPDYANLFLKWIFNNQANPHRVKKVKIKQIRENEFEEIPDPLNNLGIDPSDLKFIAAAIANNGKAQIAEASDSKWIGWERKLTKHRIKTYFLCKQELNKIFKRKIG